LSPSDAHADALTEEELAERADITVERVRQLVALGIIAPADGAFRRRDVLQARVVANLEEKGIAAEALATALAAGELSLAYLEHQGRRHPSSGRTYRDLAAAMGIGVETLRQVFVAFGFPRPDADEDVRQEDEEALRALPVLLGAGVDEGRVLQLARVWGDSVRRVAQYQVNYLHTVVEEPYRRRGMRDNEAYEAAVRDVALRSGRSGEELLGWLFRRHAEAFMTEHQFDHVETALENAGVRTRSPKSVGAAAFADLTGYTSLTETAGDEVAASVSLSLAQLVSEITPRHHGAVVKMLGDGVHFHFPDPADAVRASLEIVRTVRPRDLPPAHVGVNAGPMIYDEGDYFGRTVNIAARIAAKASADQVFVGEDLARVVEARDFTLREVGAFELKGIAQPVTIFEALEG
jgi:adenylate cyclase